MTKQGTFKRAVRERARRTGQRYTAARADLETAERQAFVRARPHDPAELAAHLEQHHRIRIDSMAPIDDDPATRPRGSWPGHYPGTLLVRRTDGDPWIARVFSSAADSLSRVEGDADVLRFLAEQDFPAERLVDDPVSVCEGSGVIVTRFVDGGRPTDAHGSSQDRNIYRELGGLLGRLHGLSALEGAPSREGGAEETDGGFYVGRPGRDLDAAMSFLVSVEDEVAPEGRAAFERLRDRVEEADDAEGLPEAFTHSNFHLWSAVGSPGDLTIVGWAGSGRGARLPALGWLLSTAAEAGPELVTAAVRGYAEQVELTSEELDRLPGVLAIRPLWLSCLDYRQAVRGGRTPTPDDGWPPWDVDRAARCEQIAAQVIELVDG